MMMYFTIVNRLFAFIHSFIHFFLLLLHLVSEKFQRILQDNSQNHLLTQLLVEESIVHIIQAVNHPPLVLVFKSAHPYESHSDKREKIHIPGASALMVCAFVFIVCLFCLFVLFVCLLLISTYLLYTRKMICR